MAEVVAGKPGCSGPMATAPRASWQSGLAGWMRRILRRAALTGLFRRNYDVAVDGRFLMVRAAAGASGELDVIFNWFTEIERRFGKR